MFSDTKPIPLRSLVLSSTAPLSKDQQTFNRLIQQIETRRARLAEWHAAIPPFRQQVSRDLQPLLERERVFKAQLAERLDWAHGQTGVTKAEKQKLSALIIDLALYVLDYGEPDKAMKALYNKHSRSDFDAEETAQLEQMKFMLEDTLGVDLGDDFDLRSPEQLLERLQTHFQAQEEARPKAKPRRKTAKQQAREAQREAEAKQLSQSLREVYRKLAVPSIPTGRSTPRNSSARPR
ncbi:hypothetical protein [Candidatus Methylocalor cossyra]